MCEAIEKKVGERKNLPTAEEFSKRVSQTRKILKRLGEKGKGFFYNPANDMTSFTALSGFRDAGWMLILAEDLFKNDAKKEIGFLLLDRLARPLELLEKRNAF